MRAITDEGMGLIRRFEGFSAYPYRCAGGYATIGYGHVIRAGEDFSSGIGQQQAETLLEADVAVAAQAVLRLIEVPLGDGPFDALVSFTFNLGAGALQRSRLRSLVNRGEDDAVPAEFRRWVFAGGRKQAGLVRRREAEIRLFVVRGE